MKTIRRSFTAAAAAAALVLAACGSGGEERETANASAPETEAGATVTIEDFAYSPNPIEVKAGAKITVKNADAAAHTLTADDGSVDTGNLAKDDSKSITVEKAGTLAYHCDIHDYMKGVIRVS